MKPEKLPAVIARARLDPSGVGGRAFDFRAFGGFRFAAFLVVDFEADLTGFWLRCPRVDIGARPSVLSGCELMTSGDTDVPSSMRGLLTVSTAPETPKSGALWPDYSGASSMIFAGSLLAADVADEGEGPALVGSPFTTGG